jgi:hypothetical protein
MPPVQEPMLFEQMPSTHAYQQNHRSPPHGQSLGSLQRGPTQPTHPRAGSHTVPPPHPSAQTPPRVDGPGSDWQGPASDVDPHADGALAMVASAASARDREA